MSELETQEKKPMSLGRRAFLIGSTAVVGGVAFGVYAIRRPHPNPLLDGLREGEAALTPFVKIDANGVTLITPRADKGQGSLSLQAHLIAEELDVDPHTVTLDFGQPAPVYYNTALADGGAPFPAWDQSWTAETMRSVVDVPMKLMGMQMTGGSTTTPDMFVRMRQAGAVARETLKKAASEKTGTPVADLKTKDGAVVLPGGGTIPYSELASLAAQTSPVNNVALRDPSEWRYLGRPMKRVDMLQKSTGQQSYGIDLRFENMLHATVRTNPGLGGKMES
ncbi:MAG: xanthine dehydrogenase family protein molybdopterin-binding subunit, partial [Myxococcota bacterium]